MPPRLRGFAPHICIAIAAALPLASLTACSRDRAPDEVVYRPEPSTGPFVVVAVDNHFHDIHPVDRTHIAETRPFVVKNEGRNLHNFTIVGTGISVDIPSGQTLRWHRLGDHLSPGVYRVFCRYHANVRMTGVFVVTR
jgi:hypothetical protein